MTVIATIDFETYYDKGYSLVHLPILNYVMSEMFKVHGCSVKIGDEPARWYLPNEILGVVERLRSGRYPVLAHNAAFDCAVLAYRYGFVPDTVLDTYLMARMLGLRPASLGHLSQRLRLGEKMTDVISDMCGVDEPKPSQMLALAAYCNTDVELCRKLYDRLAPMVPKQEMQLISWTVRLFLRRSIYINGGEALAVLQQVNETRKRLFDDAGMTEQDLRSVAQLTMRLRELGYEPPIKTGKAGPILATAKTDAWMREALRSPDKRLRVLAKAKRAAQSTIGRTRALRFASLARIAGFGPQLVYYGAHTGRWSGAGAINLQNLPRNDDELAGGLRKLLRPKPFNEWEMDGWLGDADGQVEGS